MSLTKHSTNDVRTAFLEYFGCHGHEVMASGPLVPRNDPTLLFTNAGMVPFKNIFTGQENRPCARATTAQKCVRAGGKHNDLDNVGHTARHHTFFEMLGNFSFGDYFKETAIELAWGLMTREFALPAERLLVTVHASDDDAAVLWRKISGLPETKIIRIPTSDNFWQMGDTGPCGPCSEIFYDHGPDIPGGPPGSAHADGDRFIEVWNLVFMQFEQHADGTRVLLPKPSIDTGMGLERMAAVLQGRHDNYDTDLLRALIEAVAAVTHTDPDGPHRVAHRVIADHLRSSSFLIADGVLPANEGRGYVLRRIMRRAMRHAHMMGVETPVLWHLVPTLVQWMGAAYPELGRGEALITETLRLEEERFRQTLERGLKLLDEQTSTLSAGSVLSGEIAFRLYDTYGFPLDLTEDVLRGRAMTVDTEGFHAAMAHQRREARKAWVGSGETATETLWFELKDQHGATEFLGYDTTQAEGLITALVAEGKPVARAGAGTEVFLLASQTPFYGESGGQMGDGGVITVPGTGRVVVRDTLKKLGLLHVHVGTVAEGEIAVGDAAHFAVDDTRRAGLCAHHSATHLLHAALQQVLGRHVTQKGSLVAPDRLRFDISYPKAVDAAAIRAVESLVNQKIRANLPVTTRLMEPEAAIAAGAMALFGEKYGTQARVVAMGAQDVFSRELCGGTHVRRTGDLGLFHIVAESAVAAGVRRIEAVTGPDAENRLAGQAAWLIQAAEALKVMPADVPARVAALIDDRRRLEREVAELRRKLALGGGPPEETMKQVGGIAFIARNLTDVPVREMKSLADTLKQQIRSGVVALVSGGDGKASVVVGVTEDLTGAINAIDLARAGAEAVGGTGGGGRRDLAQAGGPDGASAPAALQAIERLLAK
ncbi:MAG: alanyl-tRNA synthetase [Rhodospirillaceae bacterium]|nr:MAG: alanyl-tRNA synthetase [Rhodospirillaceae bacterium]